MFDNLRQQSMESPAYDESVSSGPASSAFQSQGLHLIRSLTPQQRFILALMLFLNVTVLGCAALLVFERVALPF